VVRDEETGSRGDPRVETRVHGLVEIEDALTGRAGEVVVSVDPGIEPDARSLVDLGQKTESGQQPKVPVDGGQTDVRQPAPDLGVNPVRGRMAVSRLDHGEDELPGPGEPETPRGEVPARRLGGPRATGSPAPPASLTHPRVLPGEQ
jgi:hypothetical protein